jgi:PKD repeat protein
MERVVGGTVIRNMFRIFWLCSLSLAVGISLHGQGWPFPSRTSNTPVLCDPAVSSACLDANANKWTPGWDLPIRNFTGRYIDSVQTRPYQQGFRTARGLLIRTSSKRIYLNTGGAVFAYDIANFASRLSSGEAMVPATSIGVPNTWRTGTPEQVLRWDQFFNAEGSSWTTPNTDGWQRLYDFDWDDRGYIYLAYSEFGWGVVKDDFLDRASGMSSVFQQYPCKIFPTAMLSVKTTDGRYYAVVSDRGTTSQLWFMGNASGFQHTQSPNLTWGLARWAKSSDGTRIAVVDWMGNLSIFRNDDLVAGAAPIITFGTGFTDVASDGTNFYGVRSQPFVSAGMTVVSPSGNSYTSNDHNFSWTYNGLAVISPTIHYGGGLVAVSGKELGVWNIRLFQISNLVPTELIGKDGKSTKYFMQYYGGTDGFAQPLANLYEAAPFKVDGKVYLMIAGYALSDVYEIAGGNALSASRKAPAAGPYYGDRITFTTAANGTPTVNWNFGDGSSGTATPTSAGYPDVTHQYSGRTESMLPASYQVAASNAADPTAVDSFSLTLNAPRPGFMVRGHPEFLFRRPDASSSAPIVSGDEFVDVSDGTVDGHYIDWAGTSLGSMQSRAGGSVPVGPCGSSYSIGFIAHYGPFDAGVSPFAIPSGSDAKYPIAPFGYTVRPFAVQAAKTSSDANGMTFTGTVRPGSGDLTSGTTFSYTWMLFNADGVTIADTSSGTAALGSAITYTAFKRVLVNGPMHLTLTVTVADPAMIATLACRNLTSATSALDFDGTLAPPPGACGSIKSDSAYIGFYGSSSGCTPNNNHCASSESIGFSTYAISPYTFSICGPFTYSWRFGDGQISSDVQPNHHYSSTGTYNVSVTITDASGKSADFTVPVAVNTGSPAPTPNPTPTPGGGCGSITASSAYIGFYGGASGCTPTNASCTSGEAIGFSAYGQNGYSFSCSPYTWSWNFGDGQSATISQPTHIYASGGSYNVILTITDGSGRSAQVNKVLTMNGGTSNPSNPTPTPGGCQPITPDSAYIGYYGGGTGCTPSNQSCVSGETVAFTVYPQNGYSFVCSPYTYYWQFGDGKTSNDEQTTHQYTAASTYNVSVTIRDSAGQQTTISGTIKVGTGSGAGPTPTPSTPRRRPNDHH